MRNAYFSSLAAFGVALSTALLPATPAEGQDPEPTPVYFVGDSITAGLGDNGVDCMNDASFAGYPPRVRRTLGDAGDDISVRNRSRCGELSGEGLSRINGILGSAEPDSILVLMYGTNDISSGFSPESVRYNLAEMAERADDADMVTVHSSIIHRCPTGGRDNNNALAYNFMREMEAETQETGRPFADPFTLFDGFDKPTLFATYYDDCFHPNPLGYDLIAGRFVQPMRAALEQLVAPPPPPPPVCNAPGSTLLCLNQERFAISVEWINQRGERGTGKAMPLTSDTGYFWFNNDANVELVIKVLDGRQRNDHFWVFYGALSNFGYVITITDQETGAVKLYENALGTFASVGDTFAFFVPEDPGTATTASPPAALTATLPALPDDVALLPGKGPAGSCVPDDLRLCLNDGRFALEVEWRNHRDETGVGTAVPLSVDTGTFWFFRETNVELIVKVLDGRESNGHFWVFYGALSNVAYTMTVTDTVTGAVKVYDNPLGTFASVGDTFAFPAE